MNRSRLALLALVASAITFGGCATRTINPAIEQADPGVGYRFATRQRHFKDPNTLVVLAFSGGGTRAAAFSYGVLETLRKTKVMRANGEQAHLLDAERELVEIDPGYSRLSITARWDSFLSGNTFKFV